MVSILVECGFMDNIEEAKLMLDENYQMKCARAIAKGICKYFGVEYKEETQKEDEPSQWAKDDWGWGIKNGITDGKNPQGTPTREQVVSMIRRSKALE